MTTDTKTIRAGITKGRYKEHVWIDLPPQTGANMTCTEWDGTLSVAMFLDRGQVKDLIAQLAGAYAALEEKADVGA